MLLRDVWLAAELRERGPPPCKSAAEPWAPWASEKSPSARAARLLKLFRLKDVMLPRHCPLAAGWAGRGWGLGL